MSSLLDNEELRVQSAPHCPLCGEDGAVLYANLRDRLFDAPGVWSLRRCTACDIVWLDPRPVLADVGKLYVHYLTHNPPAEPSHFGRSVRQGILIGALGYPVAGSWLGKALAWLAPVRDRISGTMMWLRAQWRGRLLDIGCGNGEFLARARALGWDVAGIEPDPAAAQIARERLGLNILAPTLPAAQLPAESFDAVTLSHVIEHLLDPLATLRECGRILKPGGRLIVATPNIQSLGHGYWKRSWVGLDPPRHIILFSPRALRRLVEQAGLRVVELRTVARFASWMWVASRGIHQHGRFPLGRLQNRGALAWVGGLAALGLESLGALFSNAGEETLLIATRPTSR